MRGLVASRTTPIPSALPPKNRRKAEAPAAEAVEPAAAGPAPAPPQAAPAPPATAPAPAPAAAAGHPAAGAAPPPPPAKADALLRLKKRSRAVVALAPSPAFADMMKDFLQEEGYGRVMVTHTQKEFQEFLQQPNLAVLFIDGNLATLDALQFVSQLRGSHPALPPVILAVDEASTGIVLAASRNGVSQILVKPYGLDQAFSALLQQQMGL